MTQKAINEDLAKNKPLECIVIEPKEKANATLIGLHGLGTSGEDFQAIASMLHFAQGWHVRMIFPHAPQIPVTVNQHLHMPAWYDIKKMDLDREVDEKTVEISRQRLSAIVEKEIKNKIDSRRIILAGFSQGGAMAASIALPFAQPLGGLVILSAYLLNADKIQADFSATPTSAGTLDSSGASNSATAEISAAPNSAGTPVSRVLAAQNRGIPIFMAHGKEDEIVPHILAQKHQNLLQKKGYNITWKTYENMGHSVCVDEMRDLSQWLKSL